MMNVLKKHKWIWIIGAVILVLVLGSILLRGSRNTEAVGMEIGQTAVAFIGDLSESATASGQVQAQQEATLSLAGSGLVDQIFVEVGQTVQQGDVLVQLDPTNAERALASAEKDVAIAEAELSKLLAGPSDTEIAAAEAALLSAQIRLDDLLDGPSPEQIAASEASVNAARANMWSASGSAQASTEVSEADILSAEANLAAALEQQEAAHNAWVNAADCRVNDSGAYECVPKDNVRSEAAGNNVQLAKAQVAIAQARLDELKNPDANQVASSQAGLSSAAAQYDAAVARHEALLAGASEADIAAAEADLAAAQASLNKLLAGPSDTDLIIYQTRLAQAETSLQEARNALAETALPAPFDGTVTALYVNQGELASGPALAIVDTGSLEAVLSVDEIDVGRLSVGQPARVTMETWPDDEINSTVAAIAPSATNSPNGIVAYDVHLSLGDSRLPILVGMTANAELVTANREDVLLVPNSAITADREQGTFTVNLVRAEADGSQTVSQVEVSIGLKDKQFTQITSGLVEGDVVMIGELEAPVISFAFGPEGSS